ENMIRAGPMSASGRSPRPEEGSRLVSNRARRSDAGHGNAICRLPTYSPDFSPRQGCDRNYSGGAPQVQPSEGLHQEIGFATRLARGARCGIGIGGREWESNPLRAVWRPSLALKASRPTGNASPPLSIYPLNLRSVTYAFVTGPYCSSLAATVR